MAVVTALIGACLGALAAVGIIAIAYGARRRPPRITTREPWSTRWTRLTRRPPGRAGRVRDLRLLASAVGGLVGLAVTGLPIVGLAIPVAVMLLPWLLSNPNTAAIVRTAAIESWVRSLRSLLLSGSDSTLEGAITSSLPTAPDAVVDEVRLLVARINSRWSTERALARFADDLADPTSDIAAASLILSARRRGTGLAEVLDGLTVAIADEVRARRRIESERSTARAAARYMTVIFAVMGVGLAVLNPTYLLPYGTALGQLVLLVAISGFLASLWLIRRITTVGEQPRILPTGGPSRYAATTGPAEEPSIRLGRWATAEPVRGGGRSPRGGGR